MVGTHVLEQPKDQHRKHLHVLRDRELRTSARAGGRHACLVCGQDLHQLVEQSVAAVFELVRDAAFDGLVRQQSRDGDLICRREDLREVAGGRESGGDHTNATFT